MFNFVILPYLVYSQSILSYYIYVLLYLLAENFNFAVMSKQQKNMPDHPNLSFTDCGSLSFKLLSSLVVYTHILLSLIQAT